MEDKIYQEEQQHLTDTYAKLIAMKQQLEARIRSLNETASEEKNDIRDNLRFDTEDDEVTMETYGEIETWNRYIDSYNVTSASFHEKLRKVNLLLEQAYFARVRLQFEPDEEPEDYYIGRAAISENGYDQIIIDWRSPIAETYYNQENGRTSYEVEGHRIEADLLLRRQFDLAGDQLHAYFDTQVAIEDPLLLESLSRLRTDKMQAITTTIQKEQNAVIRHPNVPVILVNGIAGSGKTSVLLQRIAYLFYKDRETLLPENVFLMTLNPVFRQYIDAVLPDLGERNPVTATWYEFLQSVHCPIQDGGYDTPAESLEIIDRDLAGLELTEEDFLPVRQKGRTILSAAEIANVVGNYRGRLATGVRLVQVSVEDLQDTAKVVLHRRAVKAAQQHQEDLETGRASDSVEEIFSKANDEEGDVSEAQAEKQRRDRSSRRGNEMQDILRMERTLESQNGGAFEQIRSCKWLNIRHIGERLLHKNTLSALEWFYLRMALTGECDRTTRFVCIDEVQDYTKGQLMALRRYFINAHFLLLGDEFQAIREGTVTFAEIHELFEDRTSAAAAPTAPASQPAQSSGNTAVLRRAGATAVRRPVNRTARAAVAELSLMTSYRSSPEITGLFASLLPAERRIEVTSVRRPGNEPVIRTLTDRQEYKDALVAAVREASGQDGLTAIVCAGKKSYQRVRDILLAAMPDEMPATLQSDGALPQQGVFLTELRLAKGLEFDGVILPDATPASYADDLLGRHRLYTAISRATRRLTILAEKELTSLLGDQDHVG